MIDINDTQEVPGVMPEMAGQPTLQIDEKEGKQKMKLIGKVSIPPDTFIKVLRNN